MEEKMAKVQYPATVLSFLRKRGFGYVRQWVVPAPSEQNLYYGFKIYNLSNMVFTSSSINQTSEYMSLGFIDYQLNSQKSSNPFSIFFHIFLIENLK